MAVVEQAAPEQKARSAHRQLGLSSLIGAIYVLFSLIFVFGIMPTLWDEALGISAARAAGRDPVLNPFLSGTLLFICMILVGGLLFYVGRMLEQRGSQHGLRAGVFFGAVAIALVLWLATQLGLMMSTGEVNYVAAGMTLVIALALIATVFWMFTRPGFARWLGRVEDAGWFHATPYKGNQGVRVRRGTIIGLLTIGLAGIYAMVSSRMFGSTLLGSTDWIWQIPFTRGASELAEGGASYTYVPLVHDAHVIMPIFLAVVLFWVCWRIVNWPTFADFLIATEAEMNKVSWTSRRRLVQDTIVVLITVFLLTAFLFVVDILWIKVLTHPWVSVLQVDIKGEFQKQQQKTQW